LKERERDGNMVLGYELKVFRMVLVKQLEDEVLAD
jgi:hypothetical protein